MKTPIQSAGEAVPKITRRFMMGGMAVIAAPVALASAADRPQILPEPLKERRVRLIAELNAVLAEETGLVWNIYDSPKNGVLTFMDVRRGFEPGNLSRAGYEVSWRLHKEIL